MNLIQQPILLVDMDGVLVDIETAANADIKSYEKLGAKPPFDVYDNLNFATLQPMEGAIEAIRFLGEFFQIYVCSTAPWSNPQAWKDKRLWIENHFPELEKKLILTHRKDLVIGDYLIDDRTKNGAGSFSGKLIQFGEPEFKDWEKIKYWLCRQEDIFCQRCCQVKYDVIAATQLCGKCLEKLDD